MQRDDVIIDDVFLRIAAQASQEVVEAGLLDGYVRGPTEQVRQQYEDDCADYIAEEMTRAMRDLVAVARQAPNLDLIQHVEADLRRLVPKPDAQWRGVSLAQLSSPDLRRIIELQTSVIQKCQERVNHSAMSSG